MKKINKLLLALGSVSSLAALPLIAASCDKDKDSKDKTKKAESTTKTNTSEGTTTDSSNSSTAANTLTGQPAERPQGDAPSLGSAPRPKNTRADKEYAFWQGLGDFSWLGAEENQLEEERLEETANLVTKNSEAVDEAVKNNYGKLTEEDLRKAGDWEKIWEGLDRSSSSSSTEPAATVSSTRS
ncbi:Hypothetical protein, predicted lipoprotein [Metamycoplasma auris 15026]|uniref:Lipoprotein n=1 Tax=Metamycoplasma auris 15026 TaxID=1188233 RepID=N9VA68_9BACT|nr:variable surface lipoprotein [Metamycoplasma auris]ENY68583.1 Hypothetical protein, predicted lipoprotein [Metamycoplasma auris 15026]